MTPLEVRLVMSMVHYPEYRFEVREREDGSSELRAVYFDHDITTGNLEQQQTRWWPLPVEYTKSQVVQTAFKACLTSAEHRCREGFKYRGRRVYSPHCDVDALWEFVGERGNIDHPNADDEEMCKFDSAVRKILGETND